jgi:DNA mismatch endonuclease (patch repair protein)
MQANRRTETKPEIAVRSALHALGLRFRKDHPIRLPDRIVRPDIVFTRRRLAVFIDGCFWHRCPIHGNVPRANNDYWAPKLDRNVARDRAVDRALRDADWQVLRAWEHESPAAVAVAISEVLGAPSPPNRPHPNSDDPLDSKDRQARSDEALSPCRDP